MTDPLSATPLVRIEAWLSSHRRKVLAIVIVMASLLRLVAFQELHRSPVMASHEYSQMDMRFFSEWAERIAWEDALGTVPIHPLHLWHKQVAEAYYDKHPTILDRKFQDLDEKERQAAAKKLWDRWYGETRFHQEPLYPYLVAVLYRIWGSPDAHVVYVAQMAGGVVTLALLFLLTAQLFGDLVALLTAALAMLWGPLIHYEVTLLRTSFITLAGVVLLFVGQRIIDGCDRTGPRRFGQLFAFGCLVGIATALKTTFLVFSAGLLVMLFWPLRGQVMRVVWQAVAVIAGIVVILAPIWIRNHLVGAPLFSMTSVGAVTFAGANVPGFVPSLGWYLYFYPDQVARVMEECGSSLLRAVASSVALHDNLFGYAILLFKKFAMVWHWYELPNNTLYYYSCLHSKVLAVSRVSALLILPGGLVGIGISVWQRHRVGMWLWYLVCCFVPLVVFYVVSRLRVPMVVAMVPFAAFAIVWIADQLLARRSARAAAAAAAFAALVWMMARPLDPPRPTIQAGAYAMPMHYYYMPKVERLNKAGNRAGAVKVLQSLLATRPAFIDKLGWSRSIETTEEAIIARDVFAKAYEMCARAAAGASQGELARQCSEQAERLQAAVQLYFERHPGGR